MKDGFRQSMAWLHTWIGLLPGWLLFVIFLFGTTAFFQQEISRWMRPELTAAPLSARALDAAGAILQTRGAGAARWMVSPPGLRGGDPLKVSWLMPDQAWEDRTEIKLDPATGRELAVRDTQGGYFLYRFHFELHYVPWWVGRYVTTVAALAMLVGLISGIVTHKKIFADFFQLRFGKGQRSWLDAHNVTGVLSLPFHLMITYTGLVGLLFTLMPWAITANFPTRDAFNEALLPPPAVSEASGTKLPVLPLSVLVARARPSWPDAQVSYIDIANPGDSTAQATLYAVSKRWEGAEPPALHLNAATGTLLRAPEPARGGAFMAERVMIDLHTGWFAAPALRWLYFVAGATGTAMIATGLVLWTVKRRARLPDPGKPYFGFALVERLNIGFLVGTPMSIAAYFLANRLLPIGLSPRADWEINTLFIAWGAALVWAIARPARRAWTEMLIATAALYLLVPIVSAATTSRGLLPSIATGDSVFIAFDLVMLAMAAGFAFIARKLAVREARR